MDLASLSPREKQVKRSSVYFGLGVFQASGDKAFLCPSWLFDFEISREFWANPHITVIYRWWWMVWPGGRKGGRRSAKRPAKGAEILLNFKFIPDSLS